MLCLCQQHSHLLPHFGVGGFGGAQGENVPPFAQVGLHDDARGCGVGQNLTASCGLQPMLSR